MTSEPQKTSAAKDKKSPLIWALLAVPYLALCFPQIYARSTPTLLGFPFFYWYQFVWVVLTSVILGVVYRKLKD
jgi:uncharacterized membrane protein